MTAMSRLGLTVRVIVCRGKVCQRRTEQMIRVRNARSDTYIKAHLQYRYVPFHVRNERRWSGSHFQNNRQRWFPAPQSSKRLLMEYVA